MKLSEIINVCNEAIPRFVEYEEGEFYGPFNISDDMLANMDVDRILYCVTATQKVVKHFKENNYDLLISHHPCITDVPQLIYHTALDCCKGGLNDMWADALGLIKDRKHFDKDLGWYGKLEKPIRFSDLLGKVRKFSKEIDGQVFCQGDSLIESIVICSGYGGIVDELALDTGADCYILGQAVRPAYEMGFKAVIETGHTNSEWQGVNFFADLLPSVEVNLAGSDIDFYGTEIFRELR